MPAFKCAGLMCQEQGSGFPVLLISGLNGLAAPWAAVAAQLARTFRVLSYDHRGIGASDREAAGHAMDDLVGDAIGLLDALGIAQAHVVGHSLGGAIAQRLAIEHPSRISRMVLLATWAGPDPDFVEALEMRADTLRHQGVDYFLETSAMGIYPRDWIVENAALLASRLPLAKAEFAGSDVMLARMQTCLRHDERARLGCVVIPALVIGVQDDRSVPAHCSVELASLIPTALCEGLPYGGHNPHVTVPIRVAGVVSRFIGS